MKNGVWPGDPRHGMTLSMIKEDVANLHDNLMLVERFLDYLLQRGLFPAKTGAFSEEEDDSGFNLCCGSFTTFGTMTTMAEKATSIDRHVQRRVTVTRNKMLTVATGKHKFMFPLYRELHFSVIVITYDSELEDPWVAVECYDSMGGNPRRTRNTRIKNSSTFGLFLDTFCSYWNKMVWYTKREKRTAVLKHLLTKAVMLSCPQQDNGIDCGLFSVVVILHLLQNFAISATSFSQEDISGMRSDIVAACDDATFASDPTRDPMSFLSCDLVCQRFPLLCHSDDTDDDDTEDDSSVEWVETSNAAVQEVSDEDTDVEVLFAEVVKEIFSEEEDQQALQHKKDGYEQQEHKTSNNESYKLEALSRKGQPKTTGLPLDRFESNDSIVHSNVKQAFVGDTKPLAANKEAQLHSNKLHYKLEKASIPAATVGLGAAATVDDFKIKPFHDDTILSILDSYSDENGDFATFDQIDAAVREYEETSGICLGIVRSAVGKFRLLGCKEHVGCVFRLRFRCRERDNTIQLKTYHLQHTGTRRGPRAKGGRRWKKRTRGLMKDVVARVLATKSEPPVPADIIKTAATMCGEDIKYFPAWRKLQKEGHLSRSKAAKAFQLIPPYLQQFKKLNLGSTTDVMVDEQKRVLRLFVCPGLVDGMIKCLRPVVSLDSAHLKSVFKGGIQIYSGLTAADEIYIYAFAIVSENESFDSWDYSNELFAAACPNLQLDNVDTLEGYSNQTSRPTPTKYHDVVFVCDRDKGLAKSLDKTFPNNHSTSCSHHILMNTKQKYGAVASKNVIAISKAFGTRQEEHLFRAVHAASPPACSYLVKIPPQLWRSSEWLQDTDLPPRFGITTSNTSECVNSMINAYRSEGWMELLEALLHHMTHMISENRQKYKDKNPEDVVPKIQQILKKRWHDSADMTVCEIEADHLEYKVSEERMSDDANNPIPCKTIHHSVFPETKCCSCGKWQDNKYPCRHAVTYFRKWLEKDLGWILRYEVHYYYKYKSLQELYKRNIFPVIVDQIRYDNESKPPPVRVAAGRPKKKRYRNRTKFIDQSESPIVCSKCGERGHNRRTCGKK